VGAANPKHLFLCRSKLAIADKEKAPPVEPLKTPVADGKPGDNVKVPKFDVSAKTGIVTTAAIAPAIITQPFNWTRKLNSIARSLR
jgi:hypothetical protein